jgi:hypothetical protein
MIKSWPLISLQDIELAPNVSSGYRNVPSVQKRIAELTPHFSAEYRTGSLTSVHDIYVEMAS